MIEALRPLIASKKFHRVLDLTSRDPSSLTLAITVIRARAFIGLGRWQEALATVALFEAERSASAQLLEVAAEAASGAGDWEGATTFLARALTLSDLPRLHFRHGLALFNSRRLDECLTAMRIAALAQEYFTRAQTTVAKVHLQRREAEQVISACRLIVAQEPDNEFALSHLFRQYLILRDFQSARAWFEVLNHTNPEKYSVVVRDVAEAERTGKLCVALAPFRAGGNSNELTDEQKSDIAQLFYLTGDVEEALAFTDSIFEAQPPSLMSLKVKLAEGVAPPPSQFPDSREGRIAKSLSLYISGEFEKCRDEIDTIPEKPCDTLALKNFACLAAAHRSISNRLYYPSNITLHKKIKLPIIQQLWVNGPLSNIERLSIRSFLACGHVVHLYTYDLEIEVPAGCVVKDAREILPASQIFSHSLRTGRNSGSLAGFADIFRWKLVYEKGGAWADCDVVCLEPIRSRTIISTELGQLGDVILPFVTNCFFVAGKGENAFRRAWEELQIVDPETLQWGEAGIHKMAGLVAAERWGARLASPTDFCPIPSFRIIDSLLGAFDVSSVIEATKCRAVHLYNEMIRDAGMNKNGAFPDNGLIAYLEKRVAEREGCPI